MSHIDRFKDGDRAVWRRQERDGLRRITPIPVLVEKSTDAGNYVVSWERDGRRRVAIATASSLEIPEDDGA